MPDGATKKGSFLEPLCRQWMFFAELYHAMKVLHNDFFLLNCYINC